MRSYFLLVAFIPSQNIFRNSNVRVENIAFFQFSVFLSSCVTLSLRYSRVEFFAAGYTGVISFSVCAA